MFSGTHVARNFFRHLWSRTRFDESKQICACSATQESGAKSPHSKALRAKFPNTRILFRGSFGSACASLHRFLCSAKDIAQFVFSVFENTFSCLRQIFSGAIDIEIQHRHCRLIRRAFAPRAPLSGAFQGKRDLTRIFFFKDIAIEIKGVAMFRYFRRPTPTALRGLLPCLAHRSVEFVGPALRLPKAVGNRSGCPTIPCSSRTTHNYPAAPIRVTLTNSSV